MPGPGRDADAGGCGGHASNSLDAATTGAVVQAGAVHGGVHVHPPLQAPVVPRQLPPPPRPFVGRDAELAALDRALVDAAVPISAVGGAGGIGKTSLVLHWAHEHLDLFPDGQLFVDLRGFSPDSEPAPLAAAARALLDGLGVDPTRTPVAPSAQAALYRSLVADKRMLVVLDNAVDAEQVEPLLPGGSRCTVVVTSRRAMNRLTTRYGAHHVRLDVLDDDEARALLRLRLGAARIAAESAAVDEVLALCKGFPLALGIVAGRATTHPHVPLAEFAAELRDLGPSALDDDDPAASLPAVLSWSHRALPPELRTALGLLGIAPGADIGLLAAASLLGLPPPDARRALRRIEEASLLERDARDRFSMHDLVRGHAADAARRDLTERTRRAGLRRVVDFHLRTTHAADRFLDPLAPPMPPASPAHGDPGLPLHDVRSALAWLDAERANIQAAQSTAMRSRWYRAAWQLAWFSDTFHVRRGHRRDNVAAWRSALDAAGHLREHVPLIRAHRHLGYAIARLGRYEEARDHLRQALLLAERHHELAEQGHTHRRLAKVWELKGDDRPALRHATRALALYRAVGRPVWEAIALNLVGRFLARLGDHEAGRAHCERALRLQGDHGNLAGQADTLDSLGWIERDRGRHREAVDHYHRALALRRDHGDTFEVANTLDSLGHSYAALGLPERARCAWREARNLYLGQGRAANAARAQRRLGRT